MANNNSENIYWIDSLRVLAAFGVIILHASAGSLHQYGNITDIEWQVANIYNSFVRFCVPIFLMISGTLIFSKTYNSIWEYLKKRVLRLLYPFLFWSLIYIAKELFVKFHQGENLTFIEIINFIFINFKDGASYHLWYIYLIIGLYLFFPIIGKWINRSNKNEIKYFLGIWFLTLFAHFSFVEKILPGIEISYFSGFIGLPVLGYYLSKTDFNFKWKKTTYFLLFFIGILVTIFAVYFFTGRIGRYHEGFHNYLSINIVLMSVVVFLFFKDYVKFNSKTSTVVLFISKYSYGIYLIHVFAFWIIESLFFPFSSVNPIIGIPVISILSLIVSTLISFGISKLPLGKYISG